MLQTGPLRNGLCRHGLLPFEFIAFQAPDRRVSFHTFVAFGRSRLVLASLRSAHSLKPTKMPVRFRLLISLVWRGLGFQ
jgi:hypothetical protein